MKNICLTEVLLVPHYYIGLGHKLGEKTIRTTTKCSFAGYWGGIFNVGGVYVIRKEMVLEKTVYGVMTHSVYFCEIYLIPTNNTGCALF